MVDYGTIGAIIITQIPLYLFSWYVFKKMSLYEKILGTIAGINYVSNLAVYINNNIGDIVSVKSINDPNAQRYIEGAQQYKNKLIEYGVPADSIPRIRPRECEKTIEFYRTAYEKLRRLYHKYMIKRAVLDVANGIKRNFGDPSTIIDITTHDANVLDALSDELIDSLYEGIIPNLERMTSIMASQWMFNMQEVATDIPMLIQNIPTESD